MSDSCCPPPASIKAPRERRVLIIALVLNAVMFVVEFAAGWLADSSGLIADSLDMLADATVYAISLYAVGRSLRHKAGAALLNGVLELLLGIAVLLDVMRRIVAGSEPVAATMLLVSLLALLVNAFCLYLLYGFRKGDINLTASWICTRNDVLANAGVILAAILVTLSHSAWPDWLIGALIATIVVRSSWRVIRSAWPQWRSPAA